MPPTTTVERRSPIRYDTVAMMSSWMTSGLRQR